MQNDEQILIKACQSGNIEAFEPLVRQYQDRILRVLYLLLGNADDAQDVGQETFIRAYRYIGSFRGRSSFSTWLHRIAVNTAHNWLRDNRRNIEVPTAPQEMRAVEPTVPESMLLDHELRLEVRAALCALPQNYRETVVLRYYDELSYEEIAEIQQVPVGTVRSRLAKGRQLLAHSLGSDITEPGGNERTDAYEMQKRKTTNTGRREG